MDKAGLLDQSVNTDHESRRGTTEPRIGQPACVTICRTKEELSRPRIQFVE